MAQLDQTSFAPALKTLYPAEAIRNLIYQNNAFMALVPKDEAFYGDSSKEPLIFATPQNRSATFSRANTINTTSQLKAFLITRVQNYAMAAVANETMLASSSDAGAFLRAAKLEIDLALLGLGNSIATQMYRGGTGSVGRISATATINSSSTMVALANPEDIVNVEVGMNLAFSAADGGSLRAYASTGAFVVSVDQIAGTFLCSATAGGSAAALDSLITAVAVSDYVYQNQGDLNLVISGLQAWLPGSAVTSTSFFGVNRTADKTRLAGVTYDGSASSIEEALIDGAGLIARQGARPDHCFVSFKDFRNLEKAIGSKQQFVQYVETKVDEPKVSVGFHSIMISGPVGPIKVIPDRACPQGQAFMLQLDTWKLKSLGEIVRLFDGDSLQMIRDPSADNLLIRCFSYGNLSCRAPGWNAVITLP